MTGLDILERCRDGHDRVAELEIALKMRSDALERAQNDELRREYNAIVYALDRQNQRMSAEVRASVWLCESLPMNQRPVVAARYIRRMSIAEIAAEQHYSESTVKRYLKDAEQALAAMDGETLNGFLPEWYEAENAPGENIEPE